MFVHKKITPRADVCNFLAGSQGDGVRSAWKARFPNVVLNLTVDLSKYHDGRIDRAYYEGTHVADVAVLQTLQDFPRWKAENKLSYYKPMNFEDLLANEKDLDGAYLPIQISAMLSPSFTKYLQLIANCRRLLRYLLLRQFQALLLIGSHLLCLPHLP